MSDMNCNPSDRVRVEAMVVEDFGAEVCIVIVGHNARHRLCVPKSLLSDYRPGDGKITADLTIGAARVRHAAA